MFKIFDRRGMFYQWDLDRKLIVLDNSISMVHFSNGLSDTTLDCETYRDGDITLVNVPNILLQQAARITAFAYDDNHTKYSTVFAVIDRPKPADYIYTETEVKNYEKLKNLVYRNNDDLSHLKDEFQNYYDDYSHTQMSVASIEDDYYRFVRPQLEAHTAAIEELKENGVEVDLTDYATKEYVNAEFENVYAELESFVNNGGSTSNLTFNPDLTLLETYTITEENYATSFLRSFEEQKNINEVWVFIKVPPHQENSQTITFHINGTVLYGTSLIVKAPTVSYYGCICFKRGKGRMDIRGVQAAEEGYMSIMPTIGRMLKPSTTFGFSFPGSKFPVGTELKFYGGNGSAAVDLAGYYTKEEVENLIKASKVEKPLELIESITLTEDVERIVRTQDANGNPYNFEKLIIKMANTKSSRAGAVNIMINNSINNVLTIPSAIDGSKTQYSTGTIWVENQTLFYQGTNGIGDMYTTSSLSGMAYGRPVNVADAIIKQIDIVPIGQVLAIGSKIDIWGVRADA